MFCFPLQLVCALLEKKKSDLFLSTTCLCPTADTMCVLFPSTACVCPIGEKMYVFNFSL